MRARELVLAFSVVLIATVLAACGGSLRRPKAAPIRVTEYVAVPFPPRPAIVEIVPPKPKNDRTKPPAEQFDEDDLVWADGTWEWANDRYQWEAGAWVVLPRGAARTRWALVRRKEDGQLYFAPSRWRDGVGPEAKDIAAPRAVLRPLTRQGDD